MQINELRSFLLTHPKSAIKGDEWAMKKAIQLTQSLQTLDLDLSLLAFRLLAYKGYFDIAKLCNEIDNMLQSLAQEKSKDYAIKEFKGTQYQHEKLCTLYVYKKYIALMPEWFLNAKEVG